MTGLIKDQEEAKQARRRRRSWEGLSDSSSAPWPALWEFKAAATPFSSSEQREGGREGLDELMSGSVPWLCPVPKGATVVTLALLHCSVSGGWGWGLRSCRSNALAG